MKSNGGLEPLVELIKDKDNHRNKELMAAVTGDQTRPADVKSIFIVIHDQIYVHDDNIKQISYFQFTYN